MTTLYVNPSSGNDSAAGTQSAPLKTISRALERAGAGTTIQLATGTYSSASSEKFPLTVKSGVTLIGNESTKGSGIIIRGSGYYTSPSKAGQNITLLLQTNANLRGVTVTNDATRGTGAWIESASPTIANCTFTSSKREGIFAIGTANPMILNNVFSQNDGNGLAMAGNAKGEIRGNKFQNTGYGLAIQENAAPLIIDNHILDNRSGIVLSGTSRPVLRKNRIEKNAEDGLTVISQALPDLGNSQDNGDNIWLNNGQYDLQNATNYKLISVGNQLNPTKVKGPIDFLATEVSVPTPSPTPGPSPTPVPTPLPTPTPGQGAFPDIAGHWAKDFIEGLASRDIIKGFPDGTFKPNNSLTRAEYAALLAKAFDLQPIRPATNFKDIPATFWARAVIEQANRGGFLAGYPDLTFRPSQNLTREQALVSLVNGLGLTGGVLNSLSVYADRAQISTYALDAIATATSKKMVVNYPQRNQLSPGRDITRAEIAAFVYQTLVATSRATPINSPYIV